MYKSGSTVVTGNSLRIFACSLNNSHMCCCNFIDELTWCDIYLISMYDMLFLCQCSLNVDVQSDRIIARETTRVKEKVAEKYNENTHSERSI